MNQPKAALVTGGGRGFGRAIALSLAGGGFSVAVTGRTPAEIEDTAAAGASAGHRMLAITGDVTSPEDVHDAVRRTEDQFGPIHVLVHNAGILKSAGPIWASDADDWWQEHEVHVHGALLLIQAVVPRMIQRGSGRVIMVSSNAATRVLPNASGYSLSKRTLNAMAEYLAVEGRDLGIRAFAIHPGGLVSRMVSEYIDSPPVQQSAPNVVGPMAAYRDRQPDEQPILQKCGELCLRLASGSYDALSGSFLTPNDDLDALVRQALQA